MGAMIFPNKSPNLIQIKFKGVKTFEFKIPSIKNVNEIITDHTLISLPFNNGQKAISKKTIKKNYTKTFIRAFCFHRKRLPHITYCVNL